MRLQFFKLKEVKVMLKKARSFAVLACFELLLITGLLILGTGAEESLLQTLIEEANFLFAQDYDKKSLRDSIALYEQALGLDPYNQFLLNRLSQAHYKLAYIHLFVFADNPDTTNEERVNSYEKGLVYGMRSLELNPLFKVKKDQNQDFTAALEEVDDVAALHWVSCNWGKILERAGISFRALFELPQLKAVLERALEVDRDYLYGGPLRAMASYWAGLPWWPGLPWWMSQDLDKAKILFEQSIKSFPDFLGNRALYIQEYIAREKNCLLLQEQVQIIRESPIHEDYRIWDMAAKIGIEKFLETTEAWCFIKPLESESEETSY